MQQNLTIKSWIIRCQTRMYINVLMYIVYTHIVSTGIKIFLEWDMT